MNCDSTGALYRNLIKDSLDELSSLLAELSNTRIPEIQALCDALCKCYQNGGKLIACGNGGSASDAQHIAAELAGRFLIPERPALAAVTLDSNSSLVTAAANDYGYENVFSRQMEGLASPGDVALGISTSGNSENVIRAMQVAREKGAVTAALLGGDGGRLKPLVHIPVVVPSAMTPRIQECHIAIGHIVCDMVERRLFAGQSGFDDEKSGSR